MFKRIPYILLISFYLCIHTAFSQSKNLISKQNLTISDGLAHNGVTSMLEDSRGFLWFGTYDGLNKYDGYKLKVYKNTIGNDLLVSNRVRSLAEDRFNNIWIGTDEGISIYNYDEERFKNIYSNRLNDKGIIGPIVRKIILNNQKELIICATEKNGILVFNENQTFIGQYVPSEEEFGENILFFDAVEIENNNYVFSTSVGLLLFNSESKTYKKVLSDAVQYSNAILEIDNSTLVVTLTNGIAIIGHYNNGTSISFKLEHKKLREYEFKTLSIDPLSNLWLGTLNEGFLQIDDFDDFKKNKFYKTYFFKPNTGVLRSSFFYVTSTRSCWFGTFNEGLFKFNIDKNPFKNYRIGLDNGLGPQAGIVTNIVPFNDNSVYLRANIEGIALYNTKKEEFEPLPFNISKIDAKNTEAIYIDSKKNTWLKIKDKGLFRIRSNSEILEKIEVNNLPNLNSIAPRSFTEDSYGSIWIGGLNDVYKISINANNEVSKVESLNSNSFFSNNKLSLVRFIYIDTLHDFLWFGSDSNGLFRVKVDSSSTIDKLKVNQFTHILNNESSISSDFVTSITRLPNEELWVGTEGGGICKVINSENNPEFITYSEKQGLSNNVVKSIQFDTENNLWISTNVGLNKFDTKELLFRKFGVSDGLPFEDFWFISSRLDNGYFLFSGLDGICYFNPEDIIDEEPIPRLEFGDFKIFNKSIAPGDSIANRVLFNKRPNNLDKLKLQYNENMFSIQLKSLHFSNPDNHILRYRLLPINEEWIEVPSDEQTISYNGLQPGEYELNVMASNSINKWSEPKVLNISIAPPIWKTWQAYLLYSITSILLLYIIIKVILRIQKLNHDLVIEQLEIDNIKKINDEKLRFFANISHELKTPLALIRGPVDILFQKFGNFLDVKEKLNLIKRQSKKIHQLIEQVQDFRKIDANALKMDYSRFNFDFFIQNLTIDFKFLADNDQKTLEIVKPNHPIIVSADKDKLEKIFNNLLSNAFKYTGSNDSITITYKQEGEKDLVVSVTDTGRGIDTVDIAHIFERFYQSHKKDNKHVSGSGIGLAFSKRLVEMHYGFINADSKLNEGTTIEVRLPVVKKHLSTDILEDIDLPIEKEVSMTSKIIQEQTATDIVSSGDFKEAVIFYAEDNLEMRNFVSSLLSKYFIVKSFRNGQECFDAMEDQWPDIVISDVQMPEMNGLDLCQKIKSDLKTSHIPVILLTALTNIEDHLQGIRDGADAYIKKPFNVQRLITNVEALLIIRKQLRERYQVGIPLTKENNKNNRNDNAFLEKLYSIIEENLDNQEFDLNNLARELYLNRTHFYQKVKVLTNQTPFELLKMYRLKKAADLLLQERLSVNEVFVMTGFNSRTHFAKVFKERYNTSPGKYAAETKKKYSS